MEWISSRTNSKIKLVRALKAKKQRQVSHLALVEGIFPVGSAVSASQAGKTGIEFILYSPDLLRSEFAIGLLEEQESLGVPCFATSKDVFASAADKENPQGILAVVRPAQYRIEDLDAEKAGWCVALVSPQDPGNVGAVLRSLDAAGANALLLLDSSIDAYHPNTVRASMGTCFWYPIVKTGFADFLSWSKKAGYWIYGTSAQASQDYRQTGYRRPCVLLLGGEREGLTTEQKDVCDALVRLPMRGQATSLNLAVATGIMLYAMMDEMG